MESEDEKFAKQGEALELGDDFDSDEDDVQPTAEPAKKASPQQPA